MRGLYEAIAFDLSPSMTATVDFGIASNRHWEALYYPIREGEITLEQLDEVLGDGPAITELVNAAPSNPHAGIVFSTPYDEM